MKMIVVSDLHLDASTAGLRRFDDVRRGVDQSVDAAIRDGVDVWMCLGDVMNADCGSCAFKCIDYLLGVVRSLEREGIQNHWIAGNHDVIEDGSGYTTLSPLCGYADVHERPGSAALRNRGDGTAAILLALPFTAVSRDYDPQEFVDSYLHGIGELPAENRLPLVVAGHMTGIPGIIPGSETRDMARGRVMHFPEVRYPGPLLKLNGHFHQQQVHRGIRIPGAMERLTFGEMTFQPGWLAVEL